MDGVNIGIKAKIMKGLTRRQMDSHTEGIKRRKITQELHGRFRDYRNSELSDNISFYFNQVRVSQGHGRGQLQHL